MNVSSPNRTKPWILALKLAIVAAVVWGIWHTVAGAWDDIQQQSFSVREIRPLWIVAAALLYLLGLLPSAIFWHRVLHALGQRPGFGETLRAYYIGHLGKYVPGKAMVVVLRAGLIRSGKVDTTVAAVSVFVETLTLMAVGAFVAAAVIATSYRSETFLLLLAVGLMLASGVPTLPPIFRRIVRFLRVARANPEIDKRLDGLSYRLMIGGWLGMAAGWFVIGASLWATLMAMPNVELSVGDWPLLTAAVCLAMVAGFLSLIPGGLGVRELVLIPLLSLRFSTIVAIVAPILLRLAWMGAELAISAVLYATVPAAKGDTDSAARGQHEGPSS